MKTAVISVSKSGAELAERLRGGLSKNGADEVKAFCFERYKCGGQEPFADIGELTARIFGAFEALVFVCACGIAVRAIAPHVRAKTTDPAVVVVDDLCKFAIPILSGHIGGANALAERIAALTGAQAVITTATDIHEKISPDVFAKANDLIIDDLGAAKEIAAALLNGRKVGLYSEMRCVNIPPEITTSNTKGCKYGIVISKKPKPEMFEVTLNLIPRNIVVGVGCKAGVTAKTIEQRVFGDLQSAGIDPRRIRALATIDIKSGEEGLLAFAQLYKLETVFFSAAELMSVPGEFSASEFVRETTGADNVCERAAVGCGGRLVLQKTADEGVTVAASELSVTIDLQREINL